MIGRESMMARVLEEIKIEHTLFALPFAYAAAFLAQHGVPPAAKLAWITVAVFGARTTAMAANRLFDARLDRLNPRTARRGVASGTVPAGLMIWLAIAGVVLLALAAYELNPLCLALLPIGAAGVLVYPFVKRWSWAVHFVLGAVDALAPLGAWIAITGRFEPGAWLLFAAVTVWVAGFDILYALMDQDFDVAHGVQSIPARFGERAARRLPQVLHGMLVVALVWLGVAARPGWLYWVGVAAAVLLLAYERSLITGQRDAGALNAAIFRANMAFSVMFLAFTAASLALFA